MRSLSNEKSTNRVVFTDTHCHIHEESYEESEHAYIRALDAGIHQILCVGTDIKSSYEAVEFAETHDNAWAIIGIHPHEAKKEAGQLVKLEQLASRSSKIVGIGEIGLDYYYTHSPREDQVALLRLQIELARLHNLPISFHVREAFDDFWPIFESYKGLRGVLHSYTDTVPNLLKAVSKGLYIGVNGISTFAKDKKEVYSTIPLESLLLETDAPFLTPAPHRGKVNEPAFVTHVAQYICDLRSITPQELSRATERNAQTLFFNTKK